MTSPANSSQARLRMRQVHLDFHTSPLIPDVAADFDADHFASTMRAAQVDSVTCFAVCHHGMSYYPTSVGTRHPHLTHDLLGAQVEALHRQDIRVPAYITVVWNEEQANRHPGWRQVRPDGRPAGRLPLGPVTHNDWQWLCMNSPYADHVAAVVEEVIRSYPIDGIFLDIVMTVRPGCICQYCLAGMSRAGLDPFNTTHLRRYAVSVERAFMERISSLIWSLRPGLSLFFNSRLQLSGDPTIGNRPEAPYFSHWEIESLASGGWGYSHFPLYNRFFQALGKPVLGMTAGFHRSWADFGTVKSQAALDYECARMLAGGAACSIGDQLHPRGILNPETYRRIGVAYRRVEECEPWCHDTTPLADIGVLLTSEVQSGTRSSGLESEEGALHMLMQLGAQFAVVDRDSDLTAFKVLIAPDGVHMDHGLAATLRSYLARGGSLLLSHESGMLPDASLFSLADEAGVEYLGPGQHDVEFLRPTGYLTGRIPAMDHALYERGSAVRARAGTEVLGALIAPYFSRTWEHFSSHAQTPPDPDAVGEIVAATLHSRVAYLSHPLFQMYRRHGYPIYRQIVKAMLDRLLPDPLVRTNAPTTAEVTLLRQQSGSEGARQRLVCHVIHFVPQRRTADLDLVEDVLPLHGLELNIRMPQPPRRVYLAPSKVDLPWSYDGAYARTTVPRIDGHAIVVFEP